MNSCLLEYATVYPVKDKFHPVILTFYFDLVPPFCLIAFCQPLYQSLVNHVNQVPITTDS